MKAGVGERLVLFLQTIVTEISIMHGKVRIPQCSSSSDDMNLTLKIESGPHAVSGIDLGTHPNGKS